MSRAGVYDFHILCKMLHGLPIQTFKDKEITCKINCLYILFKYLRMIMFLILTLFSLCKTFLCLKWQQTVSFGQNIQYAGFISYLMG